MMITLRARLPAAEIALAEPPGEEVETEEVLEAWAAEDRVKEIFRTVTLSRIAIKEGTTTHTTRIGFMIERAFSHV